ncbi:S1/P1 nuclease [bacterium]|jgi:hypothetical protein|nr:S1/P1 nuclease [bacterium]
MNKLHLCTCIFLSISLNFTWAWGKTGHRVVGEIAQQNLSSQALEVVNSLLDGKSLAQVSNWGDDVRDDPTWKHSLDWHFVDIPKGMNYEDRPADKKTDIVEAILGFQKQLASPKTSRENRIIALKWLVHLIGDIHQPLHTGIPGDHGANLVKVKWFWEDTNLHKVWDEHLVNDEKLSFTEFTQFLNQLPRKKIRSLQQASIYQWVRESRSYLDIVYDIGDKKLSYPYRSKIRPVIEKRMLEGGIRLAGVLNKLFTRKSRPKNSWRKK